jgi:excisionase family DNA binding protein
MRPDWISAQEAADLLHVSRPRIHQLVSANLLDGAHVGGRLLIHRRSVEIRRRTKGRRRVEIFSRPTLQALRDRRDVINRLASLHGAKNLRVFGSAARGDSRPDSDIDHGRSRGRTGCARHDRACHGSRGSPGTPRRPDRRRWKPGRGEYSLRRCADLIDGKHRYLLYMRDSRSSSSTSTSCSERSRRN